MKQPKDNLVRIPLRHSASIKEFVDQKAADENLSPAVLYRSIFNAGLTALYGLEIRNNQIVK